MNVKIKTAILVSVGFLFASPAHAGYVLLTFTGTGGNGSVAWGKFTVGDTALVPNYYAPGNIYGSLSMTISNIPGPRPSVVSFTLEQINSSSFTTDSNGVPTIQPLGGHSFGPPDQFNYALAGGPQPNQSVLVYNSLNSQLADTITWSTPLVVVPPSSPSISTQATGSDLTLHWPITSDVFVVQTTTNLSSPDWSIVTNEVTTVGGNFSVTLPSTASESRFFRLKWTP